MITVELQISSISLAALGSIIFPLSPAVIAIITCCISYQNLASLRIASGLAGSFLLSNALFFIINGVFPQRILLLLFQALSAIGAFACGSYYLSRRLFIDISTIEPAPIIPRLEASFFVLWAFAMVINAGFLVGALVLHHFQLSLGTQNIALNEKKSIPFSLDSISTLVQQRQVSDEPSVGDLTRGNIELGQRNGSGTTESSIPHSNSSLPIPLIKSVAPALQQHSFALRGNATFPLSTGNETAPTLIEAPSLLHKPSISGKHRKKNSIAGRVRKHKSTGSILSFLQSPTSTGHLKPSFKASHQPDLKYATTNGDPILDGLGMPLGYGSQSSSAFDSWDVQSNDGRERIQWTLAHVNAPSDNNGNRSVSGGSSAAMSDFSQANINKRISSAGFTRETRLKVRKRPTNPRFQDMNDDELYEAIAQYDRERLTNL